MPGEKQQEDRRVYFGSRLEGTVHPITAEESTTVGGSVVAATHSSCHHIPSQEGVGEGKGSVRISQT